jgi:hypothetical protein
VRISNDIKEKRLKRTLANTTLNISRSGKKQNSGMVQWHQPTGLKAKLEAERKTRKLLTPWRKSATICGVACSQ